MERALKWCGRTASGPGYLLVVLLLSCALYLPGQGHGLYRTSDARVCEVAREMLERGNFVVPHFNGEVFLEKPPLFFATIALSYKVFGVSPGAARVPTTIFAVLGLLGVAVLGKRLKNESLGVLAALITGTTTLYIKRGHEAYLDIALATTVVWSLAAFLSAYRPFTREQKIIPLAGFYVLLTAAFFIKGLVGPLVPCLTVGAYILWLRDFRAIWRLKPWLGLLIFAALTAPWHYLLWEQGGRDYFKIFYLDNHLYRFVASDEVDLGHHTEWYWYLKSTWKFFRPWSLLFPVAAVGWFRKEFRAWMPADGFKFVVSWFVPSFLFFTISTTKREDYLLPLYGALALLVGAWMLFRFREDREPRWESYYIVGFAWALAAAAIYVPAAAAREYRGSWIVFVLLAVPAVIGAAAVVWRTFTAPPHRALNVLWGAAFFAALAGALLLLPVEDRDRDQSGSSQEIAAMTADAPALYALGPSETERAFLGFYRRRTVVNLNLPPDPELLPGPGRKIPVAIIARTKDQIEHRRLALEDAGMEIEQALYEKVGSGRACALWWVRPQGP